MDSLDATVSESSESTNEGDGVEPPSADEEWGDGQLHPCMLCKTMTLSNWGPVRGSFCTKTCHEQWLANITTARVANKLSYDNRATEIIMTTSRILMTMKSGNAITA